MIEGSQKSVNNGVSLGVEVNEALASIRDTTGKVATLIGEISVASNEQAQGIDQVSRAVAEMDKVVQNNAAGSEESASAAEELSSQAEELKDIVRDLAVIVGGSSAENQMSSYSPPRPGSVRKMNNQAPARKPVSNTNNYVKPVNKSQTKVAAPKAKQQVQQPSPREVLPLTDGDLDDF
jgi:methyl-accepting chemotaxis protein